jgi:hypothetical protein
MRKRTLLRMLLRRELTGPFLLLLVTIGAAALPAAATAARIRGGDMVMPVLDRMLMRFDLSVLAAAAVLTVLRIAVRISDDHRTGWLDPYVAAGGSRAACGLAIGAAAVVPAVLVFVVAATFFAAGVLIVDGSAALAGGLPLLLLAGTLLLAVHAALAAALGVLLRNALATVFVAAALTAAPLLLVFIVYAWTAEFAAGPFMRWFARAAPPVVLPTRPIAIMTAALQVALLAMLTAALSHRLTGRRT